MKRQRLVPLEPADALAVRSFGGLHLSRDGRFLAYVATHADVEGDAYHSSIWTVSLDDGVPIRRSDGPVDREPQWSPDGRSLAFIHGSSVRARVLVASQSDWAFRAVTPPLMGLAHLTWAPDSRRLAFVACSGETVNVSAPMVIRDLRHKLDGAGYQRAVRDLWTVSLDHGRVDRIAFDGGDARQPAWAPDGSRIVVIRRAPHPQGYDRGDLWSVDAERMTASMLLSVGTSAAGPAWSPDGRRLAFYAADNDLPGIDALSAHLCVLDAGTRCASRVVVPAPYELAAARPLSATRSPCWSLDGTRLLARIATRGDIALTDLSVAGSSAHVVAGGQRQVLDYDRVGRRIVYSALDPQGPQGIFVVGPESTERLVIPPDRALRERFGTVQVERRAFELESGRSIDGWIYRSTATAQNAPLALSLHGGPHGYAGHAYSALHVYRHLLASLGWIVVTPNPMGSGTYGTAFGEGVREHWGRVNLPELMSLVDSLCEKGAADTNRLAVTGYSYGGYLAAWTVAHTRRFRAAVVGAPITNLESYRGTSDIGPWFMDWQMRGSPRAKADLYRSLSPVSRASSISTPTLLLQGTDDLRCPPGQAEELYAALHEVGCPTELVLYPGADHDFPAAGRPSHRLHFHQAVVDWLTRHVTSR